MKTRYSFQQNSYVQVIAKRGFFVLVFLLSMFSLLPNKGYGQLQELVEIFGPTNVCEGQIETYRTYNDASYSYSWSTTGGTIVSGQNSYSVQVHWNKGTGVKRLFLSYKSGGFGESQTTYYDVSVRASSGGTVAGSKSQCGGLANGTLSLSGYTGSIVGWEKSTDGGANWVSISHTGSSYSYSGVEATTLFRAKLSDCSAFKYSSNALVAINVIPPMPGGAIVKSKCEYADIFLHPDSQAPSTIYYLQSFSDGTSTANEGTTWNVTSAGTYYIRGRSLEGCWGDARSVSVTLAGYPTPPVAQASESRIGAGNVAIAISGAPVGGSYKLYTVSSGGTAIQTSITGSFSVMVSNPSIESSIFYYYATTVNSAGCESTTRITVPVPVYKAPVITSADGNKLYLNRPITLTATTGFDSYQWYKDGLAIAGATGATFVATQTGSYTVVVTKAGAGSGTSVAYVIQQGEETKLQPNKMNYVEANMIQVEGVKNVTDVKNLSIEERSQSIQYFDGLGRPVQTVVTQGSPLKKDIVQPVFYDELGREKRKFLPYTSDQHTGWYKPNAVKSMDQAVYQTSEQYNFYQSNNNYKGDNDKIVNDLKPYAETVFESSPLNRVMEQGAPGAAWQPGTGHTIKSEVTANQANEILLWELVENSSLSSTTAASISDHLSFDGVNDYVALPIFYNQPAALPTFTLEAWVNTTFVGSQMGDNWAIFDLDRSEYFNVYVHGNGVVGFSSTAQPGVYHDMYGNKKVIDGQWHHIAVVYNGVDKLIYVDGVLDATVANPHAGKALGTGGTRYAIIGDGSEAETFNGARNQSYYQGKIGEVRYWNIPRTASEINQYRDKVVDASANLLACYKFNDGKGSTKLTDFSANGYHGTLYNMDAANAWNNAKLIAPIRQAGSHTANQLYVQVTTDEDGHVVRTYQDKLGQVVLKRVAQVASPSVSIPSHWLETYYVYDFLGNLRYVLPPKLIEEYRKGVALVSLLDDYAFQYKYDERKRMIEKHVPGSEGVTSMVYDQWDRLVLTQDAVQKKKNQWVYTKYDVLNRPIVTGIWIDARDRATLQAEVTNTNVRFEVEDNTLQHGYSLNKTYPTVVNANEVLTVTYYDDYTFKFLAEDAVNRYGYTVPEDFEDTRSSKVRGLVTGSRTKVLGESKWLNTVSYYDKKYRVVQSITDNIQNGTDRLTNAYDFVGKVTKSLQEHQGVDVVKILKEFKYDHAGRLIDIHQSFIDKSITWTDVVGVTVDAANGLTKTAANGYGNAGAASVERLATGEDGWVEMTVTSMTDRVLFGFSEQNKDAHFTSIGYAMFIYPVDKQVAVYENGVNKLWSVVYKVGDKLRVAREGGKVNYYHNGVKIYTSTTYTGNSLLVDVTLHDTGNKISDIKTSFSRKQKNKVLLAHHEYNELGELVDKKLHSEDAGATFLQSVDYRYNIRGWMTNINNRSLAVDATNDEADDLFGFELKYNEGLQVGKIGFFNGNIAEVLWSSQRDSKVKAYTYEYDQLNRLIKADYRAWNGSWTTDAENGRYNVTLSYDVNGNIEKLNRNGLKADNSFGTMDDLSYFYKGNRLVVVNDAIATSSPYAGDFQDKGRIGSVTDVEYLYDANGNMIQDQNKGIQNIQYNYMNLPQEITLAVDKKIRYIYSATGAKLRKIATNGTITKTTDYIAGIQYENNVLSFIQHGEGRVVKEAGDFAYVYDLRDHLSNTRVSFTKDPVTGKAKIVQEDHYYPYGMTHAGNSYVDGGKNKYLYNGKELQDELGLSWYDYGRRMYQADLGRWFNVDPLAENYEPISPYNSVLNNPIRFFDFDGGGPGDIVIIIPGADFSRTQDLGDIGSRVGDIRNEGGIVKVFPGQIYVTKKMPYNFQLGVQSYHTKFIPGQGLRRGISNEDLDAATQVMFDYIVQNKDRTEGKLIIYGYSWGGVLANHLAKRLEAEKINVDQLFLVDAAAGRSSDFVDREISDNAINVFNYYTDNKDGNNLSEDVKQGLSQSSGGPGHRKSGSKEKPVNNIKVTYKTGNKTVNVNHSNVDTETWDDIVNSINKFLNE